ncbi:MAG: helix-turn-helix domain-containing protein [Deltaproteobacteria bacterium]|nr:helix-turn-helix domain-containing protein [Deltaproteobacteria bacterium]
MTESIGSYLRRERELRKISLEEVAEQTRIKIEHLHAIESEHFEKIPGMTFARGYLKAYASCIGLLPEDVLLRFEDFLGKLSGNEAPAKAEPHGRLLFWLVVLLLLFGGGTVLVLWLKK